ITINGDTHIEEDESFWLKIKNEVHISVTGHTAEGIILNDDGSYPALTFDSSAISEVEGDSGQSDVNFTFTLDQPALVGSSFDYATQDITAQSSDNDYVALPVTRFTVPEGATQFTLPVTINGDTAIENDETFRLVLSNPTDLSFGAGDSATATILNDDGEFPEFSIEAPILEGNEGNSGTQNVNFTIKLSEPATHDGVSVQYQTLDGTATVSDGDYDAITPQTVTFNTGESEHAFYVVINGDTKIEDDEAFTVQLLNPQNANLHKKDNALSIGILNDDEHSDDPLVCDSTMYISSSINREDPSEKGKMWLHKIDTTQNPFDFLVMSDEGSMSFYNALAYSDTDNYLYGLYKKELVKMNKTGKVISLGNVDDLPSILTTKQLFAGAIFGDDYYVSGPGVNYDKIFKIKLPEKTVSEITLDTAISLLDFSFTPDGKYLHGIVDGGKLVKIDVSTGHVVFIGAAHTGFQFDSTFSDKNGRFFANDSYGQGFYEFNLDTGDKLFLSDSEDAEFNDGANCLKAALVFNDYGDAPASYGAPRHNIANGLYLGSEVDHDVDAYHSDDALGDDSNGIDDEDGVTLLDGSDLNGSYLEPDTTQQLQITVSKNGYLNVWLDYDINGAFDATDQVINAMNVAAGTHTINVPIPATVTLNQTTYLRFRFSSTPSLSATDTANDGEVEDYAVKFGVPFHGVRGVFNVQRTDSALDAKDFALYTQIVGRDFDYHVVFYDEGLTAEQSLANVPIKIDLIDEESSAVLYTHYSYFSHTHVQSRIPVEINDDLDKVPATQKARFRVTYAANPDDSIVQQECSSGDFESCFHDLIATSDHNGSHLSQDNFAIRPERFFISMADGSDERTNSEFADSTLRVAAGYDYNLTLIATRYNTRQAAEGYNAALTANFDFNMTGLTDCTITDPIHENVTFTEGAYTNPAFAHHNVGHYTLTLPDDTNWTAVDQASGDCILNTHDTSANGTSKSGCNIAVQLHPIHLEYYPYQFAINLTQNNLPSNSHPDFIYISDINA
ncbi:MAG TPA: hypothetical protein ENK86_03655, partial [Campylobacterales bacterium]|nr:hypothetical protein [Campylobacterales bacterium]